MEYPDIHASLYGNLIKIKGAFQISKEHRGDPINDVRTASESFGKLGSKVYMCVYLNIN